MLAIILSTSSYCGIGGGGGGGGGGGAKSMDSPDVIHTPNPRTKHFISGCPEGL
jgi:hypothetical protein